MDSHEPTSIDRHDSRLADGRQEINRIDTTIRQLLEERMAISANIQRVKEECGLDKYDAIREAGIVARLTVASPREMSPLIATVWSAIFRYSRGPR